MSTVDETLRGAARSLLGHSDSPRLDAELLLGKVFGLTRSGLIARGHEPVAREHELAYENLIERRLDGVPVAYLTGIREFWSLPLHVTPAVLVPRPETELVVELALQLLPKLGADTPADWTPTNQACPGADRACPPVGQAGCPSDRACSILDLGTGSGAIALALASEMPRARVTGVDISAPALEVAIHNSRALGLARVDWRLGSWFTPVAGERFDLIVANPPYIAAGDPALKKLSAEPAAALCGGPTGLEALSAIAHGAAAHLHERGWLILEHGSDQALEAAGLLQRHGFTGIRSHLDFSGKPRVTLGTILTHHQETP